MSGYFDALIRSSGMTIGRGSPALTPVKAAALEVEADPRTAAADPDAVGPASTPHEPLVPSRTLDTVDVPAPRVRGRERHTHEDAETAPPPVRDATEGPVHLPHRPVGPPVESAMPDLGHSLVRAAIRWVAAGTPEARPDRAVGPTGDSEPAIPAGRHSTFIAHPDISTTATMRPHRDEDGGKVESVKRAPATPAPSDVPADVPPRKPVQIQASLVSPPPAAPVAPPAHDEIVEVSIGTIHVRVDAPPAQTVARPAPMPAGSVPGAAASRPARSALSRRALRRI